MASKTKRRMTTFGRSTDVTVSLWLNKIIVFVGQILGTSLKFLNGDISMWIILPVPVWSVSQQLCMKPWGQTKGVCCLLHGFYLRPPTVVEPLSHPDPWRTHTKGVYGNWVRWLSHRFQIWKTYANQAQLGATQVLLQPHRGVSLLDKTTLTRLVTQSYIDSMCWQ